VRWITVSLQQDEREALITLASQERRDPRAQAALILRHELERRGLLLLAGQQHTPAQAGQSTEEVEDDEHTK